MRETREVPVEVNGEARTGRFEPGVGLWVPGHELNRGSELLIKGKRWQITAMIRNVQNHEPWTLIEKARRVEEDAPS